MTELFIDEPWAVGHGHFVDFLDLFVLGGHVTLAKLVRYATMIFHDKNRLMRHPTLGVFRSFGPVAEKSLNGVLFVVSIKFHVLAPL